MSQPDINQLWKNTLERLASKISRMEFGTWFNKIYAHKIEQDCLTLGCPTEMTKNWLENKYHSTILANVGTICPTITKLSLVVDLSLADRPTAFPELFENTFRARKLPNQPATKIAPDMTSRSLQQKYTLANFMVGPENQLAYAACQSVLQNLHSPTKVYNPLFIYGGVGLGKTHLLQAIAHEARLVDNSLAVVYTTAERFTNEMIRAIGERRTTLLRKKYRQAHLLLIDDIQFLTGKKQTQVELFNTFNDLRDLGKQMVFSADVPPSQLEGISDRLSSRLGWGLTVDVDLPCVNTLKAIVQQRSQEMQLVLTPSIQHLIANSVNQHLREIDTLLQKISLELEIKKQPPTTDSVKAIVHKLYPPNLATLAANASNKAMNPTEIAELVSEYFQVPTPELLGTSRKQSLVYPRQIAWLLCKNVLNLSLASIGTAFGGKNHTTIMHGIKKVYQLSQTDTITARHLYALKRDLGVSY